MTGPKFVATSVRHVWASAAIVATVLVVAGCEFPGAEHTALPATPTPAASPAATRPSPVTVTAVPSKNVGTTDGRAAPPAIPGWVAARATRGAGAVATGRAAVAAAQAAATEAALARAVAMPSPAARPAATRLKRVATPSVRAWPPVAGATVRAWATARAARTVTVLATARAARTATAAATDGDHADHALRKSACTTGLPPMDWYASNHGVRWTADGTHILFTSSAAVWAMTADGSRLWRVAAAWRVRDRHLFPGRMTSFDVSPDGKQVVYATCRYIPEYLQGARLQEKNRFDFDYELAVVGLAGQVPRRLTRDPAFDNYPAWSPDGTRIAFVSNRDVPGDEQRWRADLYTMTVDGGDVRRLSTGVASVAWQPPAWSPDGRSIAVNGRRQGEGEALYLAHADGAGFVRLAEAVSGGAWSPDGTRLAFARPEGAAVMLYTIAANGSDAQRVTIARGWHPRDGEPDPRRAWIHNIAWSPDGSKLLYACGDRQFCVVTVAGGTVGATVTLDGRADRG